MAARGDGCSAAWAGSAWRAGAEAWMTMLLEPPPVSGGPAERPA